MARQYDQKCIMKKIKDAAANIDNFYTGEFINYRGKTSDTGEYYTEIVAEWCCANLNSLKKITKITRKACYKVESHDGIPKNMDSNRKEELIAMAMFRQKELPLIGKIEDYQTPLNNGKNDHAGKIDLLAYDGKTLRILELKEPDSKETMLRCVLEGYTYLRTVDHEKLLKNFKVPLDTEIVACPFVYLGGEQYKEMQEDRPWLYKLMQLLNSKPYYYQKDENGYTVTE